MPGTAHRAQGSARDQSLPFLHMLASWLEKKRLDYFLYLLTPHVGGLRCFLRKIGVLDHLSTR